MTTAELLAPAGSYETFQAVLNAGADAVYLGGSSFGARAYADNFKEEELMHAIDEAHIHGKQLYLTVNTLFKEEELESQLYPYLLPYYKQGLDAVIVQDIGALCFIREAFPDLAVHTSTQMTITNRYGAELMKSYGANRVVTAREMSFEEIKDIHDHVDIEIESFVHGALCYCYSGQCLLSSMLGGRSGNRGRCAQPCRLSYEVCDADKKIVQANGYILSPRDLCTIELLPQLLESGIYSFKIEGRMKQAEYAAGVVSVYRQYLDYYFELLAKYGDEKEAAAHYQVKPKDYQKLVDFGNRSGFTDGYYKRHNGREMITIGKPNHAKGNETLQEEVREKYLRTELKEKIKGNLRLSKEFPAILEASCGEITATVTGAVPQAAKNQPLTREKVEANLKKTGNTPFVFSELEITMEDDLFLPVQALNQLRRELLDQLTEQMLAAYRREKEQNPKREQAVTEQKGRQQLSLAVSIENRSQLATVCAFDTVSDVYLDNSCYQTSDWRNQLTEDIRHIKETGKKAYYILPSIFRKQTAERYRKDRDYWVSCGVDGFVVKNFDEIRFLQQEFSGKIPIIFDHSLYTYNNRAKYTMQAYQPLRETIPLELNRKELLNRENAGSELVIYGYLPLMTSAQCVHANITGCDKKAGKLYLKDRYGKYFPVKNNCRECYNTIYNTTPLLLFDYAHEFERMGITQFRISFTIESTEQVKEILALYQNVFLSGSTTVREAYGKEYTNGHYKRGVE